ncbi:MAG TPA: prepilin-type N-terminal cleavage/methylation domain-containing protein [Candidatus Paceibacterota bacterium]|nr:prepilin-type N-terminal cleavage/methylation domain-containing protein [Candidatus Paceibacterota bacterium]
MKTRKGFTLIEVLIYSAILAVFLGAAFSFIASILGTTDNLLERNEVLATAEFLEGKLGWLTSLSTGVTAPAQNASSTVLGMTLGNQTMSPAIVSLDGTAIKLSLAGGPAVPLTNGRVETTAFEIEHFSASSSPAQIKVYLSLRSAVYSNVVATTTFFYVLPR